MLSPSKKCEYRQREAWTRGTHHAFPLRFFMTIPVTSLKLWTNIPTCFINIFTISRPLWILRIQWHTGKQVTYCCIPRSCIFQMLAIVNYELHHTKNHAKLYIMMMKPSNSNISFNPDPNLSVQAPVVHKLMLTNSALCWLKQVQKSEFCLAIVVILFMLLSLILALPLSQKFAQSWRTLQPKNPNCTYQKWRIQRQVLPSKVYQEHQNWSSNKEL